MLKATLTQHGDIQFMKQIDIGKAFKTLGKIVVTLLIITIIIYIEWLTYPTKYDSPRYLPPHLVFANGISYLYDETYYRGEDPAGDEIIGRVDSLVDITEFPTKNGQTNVSECMGQPYAVRGGKLLIRRGKQLERPVQNADGTWRTEYYYIWYVCEPIDYNAIQYISEAELGEAAAADKSYFEPFIELSPSKMEYVYLYVVDESGNPVKNINCFNCGQWDEYLSDGGGKRSGVSMPGGLLPIPLYGYIGYIEGNELELILANCDAEGKAITQNIIVELDRLKGGEICKAVWAEETPDSSAENRSDSITVTVKAPSGKDFSRYIVYVTGHNENQQEAFPAIGAAYSGSFAVKNLSEEKNYQLGSISYYEPRYTDENGTVTLVTAPLDGFERIEIHLADSIISYAGNDEYVFTESLGQKEYTVTP